MTHDSPADSPRTSPPTQGPSAISGFPLGSYQTNCYVVRGVGATADDPSCWVVDCGYEPEPLLHFLQQHGLQPEAVVLTHAHPDHIAGLFALRKAFPKAPIWIHEAEEDWLTDPERNLSTILGTPLTAPAADRLLTHGETLTLCGEEWEVRHTPGHSPGGISLISKDRSTAFVGDTLFDGSIGRHDFPNADFATLERSIRQQLYSLEDDTLALPGHGGPTTIGKEKATNPVVRPV